MIFSDFDFFSPNFARQCGFYIFKCWKVTFLAFFDHVWPFLLKKKKMKKKCQIFPFWARPGLFIACSFLNRSYLLVFHIRLSLRTGHWILQVIKTCYGKIYTRYTEIFFQDVNKYIQYIQDIYKIAGGPAGRPTAGPEAGARCRAQGQASKRCRGDLSSALHGQAPARFFSNKQHLISFYNMF